LSLAGASIVQYFLFDPAIRARLPIGEPWATFAYAVFGLGLLAYRLQRRAADEQLARARAETAALERWRAAVATLRDLANSPRQTLELNVALLRTRFPETAPLADRLERALERLSEVDRMLTAYEEAGRAGRGPSAPPR
jgi:hypothetical protein